MKKLYEDDWINYVCSTFSLNLTGSLLSLDLGFKNNYDTPEFSKIKKGQRSFPRELKQVSEEEKKPFDFKRIADIVKAESNTVLLNENKYNYFLNLVSDKIDFPFDKPFTENNLIELVNLTFYSSIPRTSLSPDAFLLYEEIKKKGKKGDVIKTGRKNWKNSLIYSLHRNHNFDSLKIFNAFDELKEKKYIEPIYDHTKKKDIDDNHSNCIKYDIEPKYYVLYVDNIPIGEPEYTYWDDLFKMKISGKSNTVAKAFSSETEAIEAINSKKPLPVKPQYYTIYNIETLEVMKNIFEDWYTALTIQKNIENIHCAQTKIVKTKTYEKMLNPWWQWKILK